MHCQGDLLLPKGIYKTLTNHYRLNSEVGSAPGQYASA